MFDPDISTGACPDRLFLAVFGERAREVQHHRVLVYGPGSAVLTLLSMPGSRVVSHTWAGWLSGLLRLAHHVDQSGRSSTDT
jgi:hypothetical protein